MKVLATVLTGLLGLGCVAASASDLPYRRAAPPAFVAVPVFTWSGYYVGANGGYGFAEKNARSYTESFGGLPGIVDAVPGKRVQGGFGGGQVGYNMQVGAWVAGLEADFQASDISTGGSDFTSATSGYAYRGATQLNYFGTVRGRIGYALDRLLIYGTGGFAYGEVKSSFSYNDNIAPFLASTSKSKMQMGYAIGGGIEYAVTANWSVRGEYLFIGLPGNRLAAQEFNGAVPTNFIVATRDKDLNLNLVRAGVNYRF